MYEALFGKDGALAPLLERILNSALEGEMDAHLSEEERSSGADSLKDFMHFSSLCAFRVQFML